LSSRAVGKPENIPINVMFIDILNITNIFFQARRQTAIVVKHPVEAKKASNDNLFKYFCLNTNRQLSSINDIF
jgi:hypothetical protein